MTGGWFPFQHDHETRAEYLALPDAEFYHRQRAGHPVDPRRRYARINEPLAKALLAGLDPDPARRPDARMYAWRLADAITSDGMEDDGHALLKQFANELQSRGDKDQTLRSSRPDLRYELGARLGVGGMAEVYLGKLLGAEGFERTVAIKRVLAGMSEVATFATMFVAEARLASRLSHPNITTVFDFHRDTEGRLCIIMEYVHGRDLASLLDKGPLTPALIIYIITETLRGLGYAHELSDPDGHGHGLIHRDMSPQNVLLSYEGAVKLTDFGLAKAKGASGNVYSETVRGKPSYMSPEQCNAEKLDPRSDLFAIGVMLHEMLAHQPLFHGTAREVMAQVMMMPTEPPSTKRSRVPADLEAVAMRLLAKERDGRYPTAEAVIADLLRCEDAPRDGRGELARVLAERFPDQAPRPRSTGGMGSLRGLPAAQMAVPPLSTLAGVASQTLPRKRSTLRWALFGGVGFGVLAALVVGLAVFSRERATETRSDATTLAEPATARDATPERTTTQRDAAIDAHADEPIDAPSVVDPKVGLGSGVTAAPRDAGIHDLKDAGMRDPTEHRPPPIVVPKGVGELVITVKPWALIELNGKPAGQTPYREALPAGRYKVRLRNENLGKNETTMVTVSPDKPITIQRTW